MVLQTLSRCLMRPNLTNTKLIRPLLQAWLHCASKLRAVMGFGNPAENLPHRDLGRSMSQGLVTTKTEYLAWYVSVMQKSWRLIECNGGVSLYASGFYTLPMALRHCWKQILRWMGLGSWYGHSGAQSIELASPFCLSAALRESISESPASALEGRRGF